MNAYLGIQDMIKEIVQRPVLVNDNSKLKAIAENRYGIGAGASNMLYIDIDIGIGSGIIINKNLYSGFNEAAGEIGHTIVKDDGPLCHCGLKGCLEAVAGWTAIKAKVKGMLEKGTYSILRNKKDITVKDVFKSAEDGDKLCLTVVNNSAKYIGIGLANFVSLFNPELIVIGGEIAENAPKFVETIEKIVKFRAFRYSAKELKLCVSKLKEDSAIIGAADLFIDKFFSEFK